MQILQGKIIIQRLFDIADEINLQHAEKLGTKLYRRARFAGKAQVIQLPNPPLEMLLGPRIIPCLPLQITEVMVRLYDMGALALSFLMDIPPGTDGNDLLRLSQTIAELESEITLAAQPIADEIAQVVASAVKPGGAKHVIEEYTIFCLQKTDPVFTSETETILKHLDIPRLLLGEIEPIAFKEQQELLAASFSYRPDDWLVIEWNSAVVIDPTGSTDIPELIELAMVQMLELRAYDSMVGKALDGLYKELEIQKNIFSRSSRYRSLSRRGMRLFVDISEISERIDNSFTFLGDSWLARVHRAAVEAFGIPHWQKQLRNKMEVLRQINELLVNQITSQNAFGIESAIVILILMELVLAFFRH